MATTDFMINDDKAPVVKSAKNQIINSKNQIINSKNQSVNSKNQIVNSQNKTYKKRIEFGPVQKLFYFITVPLIIFAALYIGKGVLRVIEILK